MDVRWDIAKGVRAEYHFFTGLSFSGVRTTGLIFHDARRQGDEVDGARIKSGGIIAPYGVRMTIIASATDSWEEMPWRSVVVMEATSFKSQAGKPAVQIPDLDMLDKWDTNRADLERQMGYPQVERLADGTGWTYGRSVPNLPLKCNVRVIKLDLV